MYSPIPTTSMQCPSTLLVVKYCNEFCCVMWEFMDRWSNVSLKIRMTLPPYMNDRQYHVNGPCPTPLLDKWLLAKLIDVLLLPCCCFYPHTHFASYGRFAGPIDSNSVNCGLTIYHPSTPYGADCCVFVLNSMCCCVPSYLLTLIDKRLVCCICAHWSD